MEPLPDATQMIFAAFNQAFMGFFNDYIFVLVAMVGIMIIPFAIKIIAGVLIPQTDISGITRLKVSEEDLDRLYAKRSEYKGTWRYDMYSKEYRSALDSYMKDGIR